MKARLPKGVGMGPGNIQQMIHEAQAMQEQLEKTEEALNEKEYEVSSGGGVCKIKIAGTKEIKELTLDASIVDPDDIETLQDIIVAGVNEAIKKVEQIHEEAVTKITGTKSPLF